MTIGVPREKRGNGYPGPGRYNPNKSVTMVNNPRLASSSKERPHIFEDELRSASDRPGPNQYKMRDFISENKRKFSIGNPEPRKYNGNPGPGAYNAYIKNLKYNQSFKKDKRIFKMNAHDEINNESKDA